MPPNCLNDVCDKLTVHLRVSLHDDVLYAMAELTLPAWRG